MKSLPQELIQEIQLRLPVKSLQRFRSVSKSRLFLISNPQFAKSHYERSSMHTNKLVYIAGCEAQSLDFEASFHDDSSVVKLNFPLTSPYRIDIMGSCSGFLLLDNFQNLSIWNPSTGVCKTLSYSPISSEIYPFRYGFGYDDSTDDYLVVLASYYPSRADSVTHFEIFSLKSNSWIEIDGTHFPYINVVADPKGGTMLNGTIHWLVHHHDSSAEVILAFDLTARIFRELPMPDEFEYDLDFCAFGGLGRCLSLFYR